MSSQRTLTLVYYDYDTSTGRPTHCNDDGDGGSNGRTFTSAQKQEIRGKFPERPMATEHADWIIDANIHVTQDNTVLDVVFCNEAAGYTNGFGYFVYDTNSPPATEADVPAVVMLMSRAKSDDDEGEMHPGDALRLAYQGSVSGSTFTPTNYSFPAGKSICWVIFADGWKNDNDGHGHGGVDNTQAHYYSLSNLNPESSAALRHHTCAVQSEKQSGTIFIGFEDWNRDSNKYSHNFNNLLIAVVPTPGLSAIDSSSYAQPTTALDFGTIICNDAYAFSDQHNDCDYNDLVCTYSYTVARPSASTVNSIAFTFHFTHRGSASDHAFGLIFSGLSATSASAGHTVRRETFIGTSGTSTVETITSSVLGASNSANRLPVCTSSKTLLPPNAGQSSLCNTFGAWYNSPTPASSVRITITFSSPQPYSRYFPDDTPVISPYLFTYPSGTAGSGTGYELRYDTPLATPPTLSASIDQLRPIYVLPQSTLFKPCYEKNMLHRVYQRFTEYVTSGEQAATGWFLSFYDIDRVVAAIADPSRSWSI